MKEAAGTCSFRRVTGSGRQTAFPLAWRSRGQVHCKRTYPSGLGSPRQEPYSPGTGPAWGPPPGADIPKPAVTTRSPAGYQREISPPRNTFHMRARYLRLRQAAKYTNQTCWEKRPIRSKALRAPPKPPFPSLCAEGARWTGFRRRTGNPRVRACRCCPEQPESNIQAIHPPSSGNKRQNSRYGGRKSVHLNRRAGVGENPGRASRRSPSDPRKRPNLRAARRDIDSTSRTR
ncbi:hypothetical protein SKAU_G00186830 [Synaphobranchus kaupii]|uniref:Uncharacterized protein n=1 Tax=Synaphobranchus kaupii TaxID=118154 RepID=A0A9Q1FCW6_SYNKA|nr:hypothetical protein SKAU_G00186830 [Synaphobranchus kaupii]